MALMVSTVILVSFKVGLTWIPPWSEWVMTTSGFFWFRRIAALYSSLNRTSILGLNMSTTSRMTSADLAAAMTSLPLPLPRDASLMSPGISRIWILAWLYSMTPGT